MSIIGIFVIVLCIVNVFIIKCNVGVKKILCWTIVMFGFFALFLVTEFASNTEKENKVISHEPAAQMSTLNENDMSKYTFLNIKMELLNKEINSLYEDIAKWKYGKNFIMKKVDNNIQNYLGITFSKDDVFYKIESEQLKGLLVAKDKIIVAYIPELNNNSTVYDVIERNTNEQPFKIDGLSNMKDSKTYQWNIENGVLRLLTVEQSNLFFKNKAFKAIYYVKDKNEDSLDSCLSTNYAKYNDLDKSKAEQFLKEKLSDMFENTSIIYINNELINNNNLYIFKVIDNVHEYYKNLGLFYVDIENNAIYQLDLYSKKLIRI